jgi:hypothetical protein
MDWCEPRDLTDWLKRSFSMRPLTFVLVLILLLVLEFRFDWMEKALGSYLATTNPKRPETGLIWETAHNTQQAQNSLDEITVDRETVQRNARNASDLSDIASLITDGQSVMISPDHFRALYMKMAPSIASQILSPIELLRLLGESRWERTYIRKFGERLNIYLIDQDNRVLREIVVPDSTLVQIERRQTVFEGSLEEWGAKPGDIVPAERFFSALESLPDDVRVDILAQPERILGESGRPVRVGFSSQLQTIWVDIGFELEEGSQKRVVVVTAREWATWRLRSALAAETETSAPVPFNPEAPIPQ